MPNASRLRRILNAVQGVRHLDGDIRRGKVSFVLLLLCLELQKVLTDECGPGKEYPEQQSEDHTSR
jgi:hypothetical protein